MRSPLIPLILAACLVLPAVVDGAYLIKLKNGKEFLTSRYWQEGRQIMFDTYGGIFGVDKASVANIEETSKAVIPPVNAQERPAGKISAASSGRAENERKTAPPSGEKAAARTDDDPIIKNFYALQEKFKVLHGMSTAELMELSKALDNFKRQIRSSEKTNDYLSEHTQAYQMGDALEQVLNSRR